MTNRQLAALHRRLARLLEDLEGFCEAEPDLYEAAQGVETAFQNVKQILSLGRDW